MLHKSLAALAATVIVLYLLLSWRPSENALLSPALSQKAIERLLKEYGTSSVSDAVPDPAVIFELPADQAKAPQGIFAYDPVKYLCSAIQLRKAQAKLANFFNFKRVKRAARRFRQRTSDETPTRNFTIVLNTYKRNLELSLTLKYIVGKLPFVDRVLIYWNDLSANPQAYDWPKIHVPVHFLNASRNSMNNRFMPSKLIGTDAVLIMDDDLVVGWEDILLAFVTWLDNQDAIVGPTARSAFVSLNGSGVYDPVAFALTGKYNLVLTNAAFVHRKYLDAYTNRMHAVILKLVDATMNCDDLAMNFLVANMTGKPPAKTEQFEDPVEGPDIPGKPIKKACEGEGLCSRPSHYNDRSACVGAFIRMYGFNPLKSSSHVAALKC